jgi:hypothetical protein
MSERKTKDAEVQRVVGFIKYPSQEVSLIEMTKTWNEADFLYALDRIDTDLSGQPKEMREQLRLLYRTLRGEREAADARTASEEANTKRHVEITRHLEELKKPHWSIVPTFRMTLIILILTAIGVIASIILAFRH